MICDATDSFLILWEFKMRPPVKLVQEFESIKQTDLGGDRFTHTHSDEIIFRRVPKIMTCP